MTSRTLDFEDTRVALLALPQARIVRQVRRFRRYERVVERVEPDFSGPHEVELERSEVIELDLIKSGFDDRQQPGLTQFAHFARLRVEVAITDLKDYVLFSDDAELDKARLISVVYRLLKHRTGSLSEPLIALKHIKTLHLLFLSELT